MQSNAPAAMQRIGGIGFAAKYLWLPKKKTAAEFRSRFGIVFIWGCKSVMPTSTKFASDIRK